MCFPCVSKFIFLVFQSAFEYSSSFCQHLVFWILLLHIVQPSAEYKTNIEFCISVPKELSATSHLILLEQLFLVLFSSPSLFHAAKNHQTGNGGLSFSYLPPNKERTHFGFFFFGTPILPPSYVSMFYEKSSQVVAYISGDHTDTKKLDSRGLLWKNYGRAITSNLVKIDGCQYKSTSYKLKTGPGRTSGQRQVLSD